MLKILLLSLVVFSSFSYADTKLSLMGSINYNSPETDNVYWLDSVKEESKMGFGAGLRALMGINDQLHFRSGAGIVQRNFVLKSTSPTGKSDLEYSYLYLNIPLTLYWQASSQVGFFGGSAINAKLDDNCDASGEVTNCNDHEVETLVFPAIIGFDFSFNEKMGLELSYEYALTETSRDIKVHSAVASFLYHFDK